METNSSETKVLSPTKRALLAVKEMKAKLEDLERAKNEPIAIIGMGCRFPGANSPMEFWKLLCDGRDAIREVPKERWNIDAYYDPDPDAPGKMSTHFGGFLERVDEFDPVFFNISPREAVSLDPQQRLLLEVSWEAIENSGLMPQKLTTKTGVFVGISDNDYFQLMLRQGLTEIDGYLSLGNAHSTASGRLSYLLDLTGPCLSVDTACSSSLVAVHLACQSLRCSECDLALAGGVNLILTPELSINFSKARMLSPDGRCKTFDATANGYVRSEGCGVIVLKRLSDAQADGDNILAVIRGSAINQDGRTSGLTVPHGPSQQAVIRQALENGGVKPELVSYVEAHGTGTSLGDPIEVGALGSVFGQQESPIAIGSVKTNIGHLESAAGIASLIKVVLSLKHAEIPPSLHFHKPNPYINWDELPVRVVTERTPWLSESRVAGVSSFGFSGTNAHVVLKEAPKIDKQKTDVERPLHLLCLSAKTKDALLQLASRYEQHLAAEPTLELGDICFTANTGRAHFNYRLSVVASQLEEAREKLAAFSAGQETIGVFQGSVNTTNKIAFLFTGQGSQYVGMGRQLYQQAPTFRASLDRCDEILRPLLEKPLLEVLYPEERDNFPDIIDKTAYTQPALFALEYALFQLWESWGLEPDFIMGHSVGEYVAATVAGVFSLEDGLKLIATRGKLMQALPQDGEMVALLASEAQAREVIAPYSAHVSIAAINAPNSVVISGQREAINAICATIDASGIKTKKLNVSHAFHSPLMSPMLGEFERVARQVKFSTPQIKLISNITGTLATEEITTPEYWCRHIRQPVQFARCIESLEEQEIDVFVEMGAKPILLGMARQCLPEHVGLWLPSLRPDREDWQELLNSLAQLYVHGVSIDWVGFNQDYTRRRVPLPTYPFQRQRYWVEAPKENGTKALVLTNNLTSSRQHPLLGQKLCLPGTKQIRFQGQISKNFPNWLQDHRVFETTIVPGTAYIEMALAAGLAVSNTGNIPVENVIIQKALILSDDGSEKIIQLVLTPQENLDYSFEIFSLEATASEERKEHQGILHASGKLLLKNQQFQGETIDLATLKSQCQEEVSPEVLYQRNEEQNINYGESFRALAQVWRQGTVALGKICLPEKLRAQVGDYQLHPVLLDACLQVLDATLLEDNSQNTYVPLGVERLLFYSHKSADIWCHAQLRQGEDRSQKTISADFHLFTEDGELIALVEGFQLKHAPRDAMLGTQEKSWQDWLYEVDWQPQARYGLFPNYLPSSAEVGLRLQSRLAELMAYPSLTAYGQAYAHLEASCVTYIVATLQEMGWEFQQGATFSTEQIAERLGIVTPHKRLLNRLLEILVEVGILQRFESGWEVVSLPEIQDSIAKIDSLSYPEAEAEITLLDRCVSNLAQVLTGKCDPLQLLFPNGDTTALIKLYQDSPIMQVTNTLVKEAVLSARERLPQGRGLRILEIGSGTGSTTNYILPHLFAHQTEYVFTDIGAFFIAKAQERFKDYPFVSYQVLDIEKDPQSQGFEPSHFDLIVAVNVLHATSDLRSSLQHVKQLLAPGGMLVLMEETAPQRWVDLTFGLTEGWWKFSDRDLRHNYPLLPPQRWRELLLKTGFSQVETISTNLEASHPAILLPQETVIVALSEAESQISTPRNWLILADTQGTGQQLGEIMRSWGEVCTLVFQGEEYEQIASGEFRINPANPSHFQQLLQAISNVAGVVHLWSLDAPEILSVTDLEKTSQTCCGSMLHLVQALVNSYTETPCLWLVTRGAQAVNGHHVEQVAQSPLWGMGKVIAVEHPELKCVRVDLDPIVSGNDAQILFEEIISSLSAEGTEDQVAYRSRDRYVLRLVRDRQSQKTLGQTQLDVPENQPFLLEISSRGSLDNLKVQVTTRQKPKAGDIEIRVRTVGLNFLDVFNVLGIAPVQLPLGHECAGEVVALGEGVEGFELGEPVVALTSGSFSQYVTVDANFVAPKPAALTFEEAATIPEAFLTAYWCLHHVAKISAGDRVLIHAAAGGVGQAAVQLAIGAGAQVFATASPSKWHVLKSQGVKYIMNSRTLDFAEQVMAYTNGQGVDIVLNCLTGEGFVERSLAVVAAKGRFVELAKRDIWNSEQVVRVRPDVQYFAIDMVPVCQEQPALVQSMLRQLIQRVENGVLLPLPQTVFPLQDAVSAFRYMQQAKHIGKIVIKFPDKIGTQERLSLRSDGTYLITGGLGGLGLLVAQWLVERGAKHLVLLSRSGLNPSASEQLEKLEQAGACIKVAQADVSDNKQLDCVWNEIEETLPPLRGIIHAAGVLDDGVLLQQNWQRFERVLAPKVQGAWNLHTLTQNRPLDFFVLFSSATSLLGNAGQANHAAANAFLDALASYRRMLLLPGLSINWGAWAEVGAAARMGLVEQLSLKGEESIAPQQGLQVLEQLLLNPPVQVGVMPINWSRFLQQRKALSPFFTDLAAEIQQLGFRSTSVTPQEGDSLKNALLSRTPAERQQLLESRITEQVARVLGFSATKFDRLESLINLGLDSLMAIELRNRLNSEMGVNLPVMKIMEGVSISSLAEVTLEQWALAQLQSASPSTELDDSIEEIAL